MDSSDVTGSQIVAKVLDWKVRRKPELTESEIVIALSELVDLGWIRGPNTES